MSVGILVVEVRKHAAVRKMEWGMAGFLGSMGAVLAAPGDTFSTSPAFRLIAERWDETFLGWFLMIFSVVRLGTLFVNGTKLRNSAEVRLFFSFVSFAIMFLWTSDLWLASSEAMSTGVAAYGWLSLFELMNISQAGADQQARNTERNLLAGSTRADGSDKAGSLGSAH